MALVLIGLITKVNLIRNCCSSVNKKSKIEISVCKVYMLLNFKCTILVFYRYLSKSAEGLKKTIERKVFSNGCYNKEIAMWYELIKLAILKWYREENKAKYLSLDSTKNWITLQRRTKSPMHVETAKKKQNRLEWCDRVNQSLRIH